MKNKWSITDRIPKIDPINGIQRVSKGETEELVIKHSEGEFRINPNDILSIKRNCDLHSVNVNPVLCIVILLFLSAGFSAMLIRFLESTLNSKAYTWTPFLGDLNSNPIIWNEPFNFFPFASFIILFTIIFYRSFKHVIIPIFIQLFHSKIVTDDLLIIETIGNQFVFRCYPSHIRSCSESEALSQFKIGMEPEISYDLKVNKTKTLVTFYLLLLFVPW
jgi:hypothetical protein